MLILYIVALLITPTAFCAYPLHDAVRRGDTSAVEALIAAGAGVNKTDQYGDIPLHNAARQGNTSAVEALIAAGSDVNKINCDGDTPLHNAAQHVIAALIAAGAQVNKADKYGNTPLNNTVGRGYTSAVEALIAAGADANTPNKDGNTPLHSAVARENISAVKALITAGADVNKTDAKGITPLHNAVSISYLPDRFSLVVSSIMTKPLLTAGALLDEKSLKLLRSKMPELLPLACAHNPANSRFLMQELDPELLKEIQERCAKYNDDRLAAFCEEHGVRNPIALIQNQRRGRVLPHRSVVSPAKKTNRSTTLDQALQQVSLS